MNKNSAPVILLKVAAALSAIAAVFCLGISAAFRWALRRAVHPAPDGASSIGVIGGADGPTAIFVTGGLGLDWLGGLLAAAAIVLWFLARHLRKQQG